MTISAKIKEMKKFNYFDLIMVAFVSVLLISNIAATKVVAIGPILTDGGAILFPIAYIFGDVLTEVYGFRYARRAIWSGFAMMLLAVLTFTAVRFLPAAAEYHDQAAFEAVLGFFPRIVVASLVAYLVGEFINSFVLAKLKIITKGKQLWLRLIGSTVVGELLDTTIFAFIAFGGIIVGLNMLNYIVVGWVFKTLVEVVMLPITYRVIAWLKKREQTDFYDKKTVFTPFSLSLDK